MNRGDQRLNLERHPQLAEIVSQQASMIREDAE
jgi:hypothetical protein